jgi:hypothetical protein
VRGQIAVRKNVKLPFRLRRCCFHPHSRAVGYSTAFFIKFAYPENSSIPDENGFGTFYPDMFDRFNAS